MVDLIKPEFDIVKALRGVDHGSVEDCFLQSPLFETAAAEIERLRETIAAHPCVGVCGEYGDFVCAGISKS